MHNIEIKTSRPRLDAIFTPYVDTIGRDYRGYRNHVERTVTYAMHFLEGDPAAEPVVETAMAYHDIGLWTDRALAYLEPSEAVALADNASRAWGFDPDLLRGIIHWHHKVFPYRGPDAEIIEACRRADWIDASMGWLRKGNAEKINPRRRARLPQSRIPRHAPPAGEGYRGIDPRRRNHGRPRDREVVRRLRLRHLTVVALSGTIPWAAPTPRSR